MGFLGGTEELQRLREMFARSPSFSALLHGPEHRFALINPAYQQLVGHRDVVGLTVREAIPEVASQGFIDLLGALNSKGYFETSNPAWQAVLGWSEEEVASMSIFELLHPDDVEHTRAEMARVLRPNLKVLFVSGYAEDATFRGDFLDPGMDMLTKPFALDALGATVHAMIER